MPRSRLPHSIRTVNDVAETEVVTDLFILMVTEMNDSCATYELHGLNRSLELGQ